MENDMMGGILHGPGTFAMGCPSSHGSKADHTIECIYYMLSEAQKEYDLAPKLYLQLDNCTSSNKTPAVLAFIAMLIEMGIFTEAEINLLFPGHTHIDIDQLFSAWLRRMIDRDSRNVTRQRFLESIRTHKRDKK